MELTDEGFDQRRYARLLAWGANGGLALLVAAFVAYVAGWIPPVVPLERLPEVWGAPASALLREAGVAPGWDWFRLVGRGDMLNLLCIALLAACSAPCLLAVMPVYWAQRRHALFAICALEVVVLVLAASGLGTTAH